MKVARGTVLDRPWGLTLGALALRGVSGQLTVTGDDGKQYAIALLDGAVIAASSPLASDSLARIALTSHLVSSSRTAEISRRIAASPGRDEIEVLAEVVSLGKDLVESLRRKVITQRAARTFSVESGAYDIDSEITLSTEPPCEVDLRAVIFQGIRLNLAEQRLAEALREIGSSYILKPGMLDLLGGYGFADGDRPVLTALAEGTSLAELEATKREIEPRTMHAMIYALVATGACDASGGRPPLPREAGPPMPRTATRLGAGAAPIREIPLAARAGDSMRDIPIVARTTTPDQPVASRTMTPSRGPTVARTVTPQRPAVSRTATAPSVGRTPTPSANPRAGTVPGTPTAEPVVGRVPTPQPVVSRTRTPQRPPMARAPTVQGAAGPAIPRTITPTTPRTITGRRITAREAEAAVTPRLAMLDRGADHFSMLGLVFDAPVEAVRAAYFNLARQLHPDKLADLGAELELDLADAKRVFAQINAAFTTLTDPIRRSEYIGALVRGESTPIAPRAQTGDFDHTKALAAEAYARGQIALRREDLFDAVLELAKAVELEPNNVDFGVTLAWAKFISSDDKPTASVELRKSFERGIQHSSKPEVARFFLGRMERMLGNDQKALYHFKEVLNLDPDYADAGAEIRVIEQRLDANSKR